MSHWKRDRSILQSAFLSPTPPLPPLKAFWRGGSAFYPTLSAGDAIYNSSVYTPPFQSGFGSVIVKEFLNHIVSFFAHIGVIIVILIGFLFSRLQPQSSLLVLIIGCVIFLVGIGIGFIGLITMQREIGYSEGLVCVQGGFLVDKGIYCLVRHPMRVGLFLELAGLVLLSNNPILFMLLAAVGFIQYFRTLDEEAMLLDHFGDIESRYMATVPRFNIIKSLAQLAMERLLPKVKPQTEPTVNPPFARES